MVALRLPWDGHIRGTHVHEHEGWVLVRPCCLRLKGSGSEFGTFGCCEHVDALRPCDLAHMRVFLPCNFVPNLGICP